jgi:hypothetical protein
MTALLTAGAAPAYASTFVEAFNWRFLQRKGLAITINPLDIIQTDSQ